MNTLSLPVFESGNRSATASNVMAGIWLIVIQCLISSECSVSPQHLWCIPLKRCGSLAKVVPGSRAQP